MASSGLLESARRGVYRVAPPLVPFDQKDIDAADDDELTAAFSADDILDETTLVNESIASDAAIEPNTLVAQAPVPPIGSNPHHNEPATSTEPASTRHVRFAVGEPVVRTVKPAVAQISRGMTAGSPVETVRTTQRVGKRAVVFAVPGLGIVSATPGGGLEPNRIDPARYASREHDPSTMKLVDSPNRTALGQQLFADRHAAQCLVDLVDAVTHHDVAQRFGIQDRKRHLATLIHDAHAVSERLAIVASGELRPTIGMRAAMLKRVSKTLARNWAQRGESQLQSFEQVATAVLQEGADLIPQSIIDLYGQQHEVDEGEWKVPSSAQERVYVAHVDGAWNLHLAVHDPALYRENYLSLADHDPTGKTAYTYDRSGTEVVHRLHEMVSRIVDQMRPTLATPSLLSKWEEGAIYRVATLTASAYRSQTQALLRSETEDEMLAPTRLGALASRFDTVIGALERKVTTLVGDIEKNARELLRIGRPDSQVQNDQSTQPRMRG